MSRVAPQQSRSNRTSKRNKLLRRKSTKRWWLSDESKKQMQTDFDSLVKITEKDHQGVGCMHFWNQEYGVMNPYSNFIITWDIIMLILILCISFSVPYEAGFFESTETTDFFYLNRVTDAAFAIDLVLNFFVPIKDAHTSNWIFDRATIMRKYLRGYFWIGDLGGTFSGSRDWWCSSSSNDGASCVTDNG